MTDCLICNGIFIFLNVVALVLGSIGTAMSMGEPYYAVAIVASVVAALILMPLIATQAYGTEDIGLFRFAALVILPLAAAGLFFAAAVMSALALFYVAAGILLVVTLYGFVVPLTSA